MEPLNDGYDLHACGHSPQCMECYSSTYSIEWYRDAQRTRKTVNKAMQSSVLLWWQSLTPAWLSTLCSHWYSFSHSIYLLAGVVQMSETNFAHRNQYSVVQKPKTFGHSLVEMEGSLRWGKDNELAKAWRWRNSCYILQVSQTRQLIVISFKLVGI